MKKYKKAVWILSCITLLICSVVYIHFVRKVNSNYQKVENIHYQKKDYGEIKTGLNMKVNRVELMSREEIAKKYHYEEEDFLTCKQNFILVWVTIKNDTDQELDFQLSDFYLEKEGWCNGLDLELFQALNENYSNSIQEKEKNVILTYSMIDTQFKKKEWNHMNIENFRVVMYPVYPQKRVWGFI